MILIVSYDLKTKRDYNLFYESLKQQGNWWHYLASTWLLSTMKSPEEVANAVHPFLDPQDSLFVAEMGSRFNGFLPKPAWDWINGQIQSPAVASFFSSLVGTPPATPLSSLGGFREPLKVNPWLGLPKPPKQGE
jgi:hypothetical protein